MHPWVHRYSPFFTKLQILVKKQRSKQKLSNKQSINMQSEEDAVMPSFMEIPLDEEDSRYSQSFDPRSDAEFELARAFFEKYGFVIFRDVISEDQCDATVRDMIALLQEQDSKVDATDPNTWSGLTNFGCPKQVNALFRPSLLRIRQDPAVHRAFSAVLENDNLIVNHDRWLLHRPPATPTQPLTRRNVHLDMNPWEFLDPSSEKTIQKRLSQLQYRQNDRAYIAENNDVHVSMARPCVVQAILNLRDIPDRQHGGTILVPGSHKTFGNWLKNCADSSKRREGPMQYVLDASDPMMRLVQHPTLRAGSMIVWDQRVFHGSTPNLSRDVRAAIPIKAFSADVLRNDPRRARERALAIRSEVEKAGFENELTEIGEQVFGFNLETQQ